MGGESNLSDASLLLLCTDSNNYGLVSDKLGDKIIYYYYGEELHVHCTCTVYCIVMCSMLK